jgi:hypothetical protein
MEPGSSLPCSQDDMQVCDVIKQSILFLLMISESSDKLNHLGVISLTVK